MSAIILPHQMDYDLLDDQPFKPGWGRIWQGGNITAEVYAIPGPLAIVCMNRGANDLSAINNRDIHAVLSVWIDDTTKTRIPDRVLIGLVDAAIALLSQGINLYVHCQMGISRSTYFTAALYMRLGLTVKEAVQRVKSRRSIAWPNWGFYDHLQGLESRLHDR